MSVYIKGSSCYDGWTKTCSHLLSRPSLSEGNIIVDMETPCDFADLSIWMRENNPSINDEEVENIRNVVNTIFPYHLASYYTDRNEFYERYERIYSASRSRKWGTYFQRLISFGKHFSAGQENQLEKAIIALQGRSPQKHFIVFHLSGVHIDSNVRPMGAPCWQFGELCINADTGHVDFVVVYRMHDYYGKALGNFIGLAKLLEFICIEANKTPGSLVVHSIYGYCERRKKSNLASIL